MGANLMAVSFETDDRAKIAREWAAEVAQDLRANGEEYSGGIGMLGKTIAKFVDLRIASRHLATDWLENNHEKWEPAIAVSYLEGGKKVWLVGGWAAS